MYSGQGEYSVASLTSCRKTECRLCSVSTLQADEHPVGILKFLWAVCTFYCLYILFFTADDVCLSSPVLFTIPVTSILSTLSRGFTHSLSSKAAKTCKSTSSYWRLIYSAPFHDMTSHGVYVASEMPLSGYCATRVITFIKFPVEMPVHIFPKARWRQNKRLKISE